MRLLDWDPIVTLPSGGELRTSGPADADSLVLLVGGGTGHSSPGKWSSSMTWLAPRVRRAVGPRVRIGQVRYLDTSWNELHLAIADVRAALEHEAARSRPPSRIVLLALSMGGATCLANAGTPGVVGLVTMAPWFPPEIPVDGLAGRRLVVVHGALDNALPFVPGTSLERSRATVELARAEGADATWTGVPLGLHGLAVRWGGRLWALPRAGAFARLLCRATADLVGADTDGSSGPAALPTTLGMEPLAQVGPDADAAQEGRDELFVDADRHGPRWPALVRRALPALLLLPAALVLSALQPWRSAIIDAATPELSDLVLVAPVLAALVLLATALAPLARVRVEPLLGAGLVLLGIGLWMARDGLLVAATIPTAIGAVMLGVAASRAVRRAVWTLPVLLAAGVSDAQSVQVGVTSRLLDDHVGAPVVEHVQPTLSIAADLVTRVDLLVVHVPAATGTWLLGLVDVVALGMLLGLAHLFWLPLGRTALALGAALVLTVGLGFPVPVLPMLGIVWLLVHIRLVWRSTRFSLRRLTYLGG